MAKGLKLPKVLTLDYNAWRCGLHGADKLGICLTMMQTPGYNRHNRCCLGQFALQAGATESDIIQKGMPSQVPSLAFGPKFCDNAVIINDNTVTTIVEKIRQLRRLCGKYHRKLVLENFPKSVMDALAAA